VVVAGAGFLVCGFSSSDDESLEELEAAFGLAAGVTFCGDLLAAGVAFTAGFFSSSDEESEESDDSCFLTGVLLAIGVVLAGVVAGFFTSSSEDEESSDELEAAFGLAAGVAFCGVLLATGVVLAAGFFSSSDEESEESDDSCFLTGVLLATGAALAGVVTGFFTSSSEDDESSDDELSCFLAVAVFV
jgi:NADH:ubiquinone oxidoreductase subunit 5 (subunit L)/multisubunit Na+/H+ antiporter MnhA subunit